MSAATSRLLTVVVSLFAASVLVRWAEAFDVLEGVTRLIHHPLLIVQVLVLAIGLAIGRQHFVVRVAVVLLCLVSLFFLFSVDLPSIFGNGRNHGEDWDTFRWIFFFGNGTGAAILFTLPGILLAMTAPLMIYRRLGARSNGQATSRLFLQDVLISVTCICIALAMLVGLPPYPNWLFELPREAFRFVDSPTALSLMVIQPSFNYVVIGYASMACSTRSGRSLAATAGISVGICFLLALLDTCSTAFFFPDIVFSPPRVWYGVVDRLLILSLLSVSLVATVCRSVSP